MKKITLFSDGSALGNQGADRYDRHVENERCDKLAHDEAKKVKDRIEND